MAFFSRPCVLPKLPAKCRRTSTLGLSLGARAQAAAAARIGTALVRSLSVALFLEDGLEDDEDDGVGRKEAADRAVAAARGPAGGLQHAAVP